MCGKKMNSSFRTLLFRLEVRLFSHFLSPVKLLDARLRVRLLLLAYLLLFIDTKLPKNTSAAKFQEYLRADNGATLSDFLIIARIQWSPSVNNQKYNRSPPVKSSKENRGTYLVNSVTLSRRDALT